MNTTIIRSNQLAGDNPSLRRDPTYALRAVLPGFPVLRTQLVPSCATRGVMLGWGVYQYCRHTAELNELARDNPSPRRNPTYVLFPPFGFQLVHQV